MRRLAAVIALWAVATGGCLAVAAVLRKPAMSYPAPGQLQATLRHLTAMPGGPPGVLVVIHHGQQRSIYQAGTASLARPRPLGPASHFRLGTWSGAYTAAIALRLVSQGKLALDSTVGSLLPALPRAWHPVTLAELLAHRSGLPDLSSSSLLARRLAHRRSPLRPGVLLDYVRHQPLAFPPGHGYAVSSADAAVIALMAGAATKLSYGALLHEEISQPAGLHQTSLPRGLRLPQPALTGYSPGRRVPVSAAAWLADPATAWAGGALVSTADNAGTFIRSRLAGMLTSRPGAARVLAVTPGSSVPAGPGANAAGLGIYRYTTRCGTVFGYAGTGPGATLFAAATQDGARSVTVTATEQVSAAGQPQVLAALRQAELLAVCTALAS